MKTEKKLVDRGNGKLETVENPIFDMPTELRDARFKPEGRLLLLEVIPDESKSPLEIMTIKNKSGQKENVVIENVTESGLLIPQSIKKDKSLKGVVVAVGDDVRGYCAGDIVMYKPNAGATMLIEIEDYPYLLMDQYNLCGKYIV